jgi:hypothetical protein
MKLKHKFLLMVAGAAIVLLAFSFAWLTSAHSTLLAEKQEKIRSLVEVPYSIVEENQHLEASGKITREEAQSRAARSNPDAALRGEQLFLDQRHASHHGDAPDETGVEWEIPDRYQGPKRQTIRPQTLRVSSFAITQRPDSYSS